MNEILVIQSFVSGMVYMFFFLNVDYLILFRIKVLEYELKVDFWRKSDINGNIMLLGELDLSMKLNFFMLLNNNSKFFFIFGDNWNLVWKIMCYLCNQNFFLFIVFEYYMQNFYFKGVELYLKSIVV